MRCCRGSHCTYTLNGLTDWLTDRFEPAVDCMHAWINCRHAGLFPMPPMPHADHSLNNGSMLVHQAFLRYAPLFRALNGRVWALRPHAVSVRELDASSTSSVLTSSSVVAANDATLTPCKGLASQLWNNRSLSGGEPGSGGLIQLAGDTQHRCLCVFNPSFTTNQCSTADVHESQIWVFQGPAGSTLQEARDSDGDCPHHANVLWDLQRNGKASLLRSAVPVPSAAARPGRSLADDTSDGDGAELKEQLKESLCLTSSPINASTPGAALGLAVCSAKDPAQQWTVLPASGGSFQLAQGKGKQVCVTTPPKAPPPPPPPPLGVRPPVVALFEDQEGAQLAVVTSPGSNQGNGTEVEITIRGGGLNGTNTPTAMVVRPGEASLQPLASVRRSGAADIVVVAKLHRGAALVRVALV